MWQDRFVNKIDELNVLATGFFDLDKKKAEEAFEDILIDAYIEGLSAAAYMLGEDVDLDNEWMDEAVDYYYGGVSIKTKFAEHYDGGNLDEMKTLVESEWHRVYNTAAYNAAEASNKPITKRWITVGDDKVRDTHEYIANTTSPKDGYFYTYDGDYARFPGDFQLAQNNANCRCVVEYITE